MILNKQKLCLQEANQKSCNSSRKILLQRISIDNIMAWAIDINDLKVIQVNVRLDIKWFDNFLLMYLLSTKKP